MSRGTRVPTLVRRDNLGGGGGDREAERPAAGQYDYDLTIRHLGLDGTAALGYDVVNGMHVQRFEEVYAEDGVGAGRLSRE